MAALRHFSLTLLAVAFFLMEIGVGGNTFAGTFTSIHAFGDGVCTTNGNTNTSLPYYGPSGARRYCNGRVWIEVLCTWQGLPYVETHNRSYFGQNSAALKSNVAGYSPPADAATALFIVWSNDADLVGFLNSGVSPPPYDASDLPLWTTFITGAVADQKAAITTLYNKGVRTVVVPSAVDIVAVPYYSDFAAASKAFVRQRVIQFNAALKVAMQDLAQTLPGLKIHQPDTFSFLDAILANPASYGVAFPNTSAIGALGNPALNGPGASYVFWDFIHPTAKVQMYLADLVQQQVCPLRIDSLTLAGGSTSIDLQNVPLARDGIVEGRGGPEPWQQDATIFEPFATGNPDPTVTFPSSAPTRLQRVRFPVKWVWP